MEKLTLNNIGDPKSRSERKRVGRGTGSGVGKTAGRGHKGQKSRSGGNVRPGFEGGQMPLYRRVPKLKHFQIINQKSFSIINLSKLNDFKENDTVNIDALVKKGLLFKPKHPLKVLGNGELKVKLKVEAHAFTKAAKEKIESLGGSCKIIS